MAFKLDDTERHSSLWRKLAEYYQQRLALLRAKNDGDLDEARTARIRGQIAEVKQFLDLAEPGPTTGAGDRPGNR